MNNDICLDEVAEELSKYTDGFLTWLTVEVTSWTLLQTHTHLASVCSDTKWATGNYKSLKPS